MQDPSTENRTGNKQACPKGQDEKKQVQVSSSMTAGRLGKALVYKDIADALPLENALLVHAASFAVDGKGILIMAESGVGKTTQLGLWQHELADRLKVINDDKPILRLKDGDTIIESSPLCGKEGDRSDYSAPLFAIIILDGTKDYDPASIEKISQKDAAIRILKQVYIPENKKTRAAAFELVNKMFADVPVYLLRRNKTPECARLCIRAVLGGEG